MSAEITPQGTTADEPDGEAPPDAHGLTHEPIEEAFDEIGRQAEEAIDDAAERAKGKVRTVVEAPVAAIKSKPAAAGLGAALVTATLGILEAAGVDLSSLTDTTIAAITGLVAFALAWLVPDDIWHRTSGD